MRKILPLLLGLVGLLAGGGAGLLLRPVPEEVAGESQGQTDGATESHAEKPVVDPEAPPPEYVKLSNQFVIPVLDDGHVTSMVILTLSLEVKSGTTEAIYAREPKLRDAFLQVLFDHANTGGFKGSFTDAPNLIFLRKALKEIAISTIGDSVTDVLVTDLARQDS